MLSWRSWIEHNWQRLVQKEHLPVSPPLPHPRWSGFRQEHLSTPAGQCRDWVHGLPDGSRIHVHEFAGGRLVTHRDRFDPNQGFFNLLAHIFSETEVGQVALVLGVSVALVAALEN